MFGGYVPIVLVMKKVSYNCITIHVWIFVPLVNLVLQIMVFVCLQKPNKLIAKFQCGYNNYIK